ncbi:MAG: hypothetical protein ACYTG0_33255 [Planctomycetota bacterium]|jgi:hypothetical protein
MASIHPRKPSKSDSAVQGVSRRRFLRRAAAVAAVPRFVPGSALGAEGGVPAGERISVGAIGTGGRGTADMVGIMRLAQSQVVAVCDCRRPRRENALAKVRDHYAQKTGRGSYRGCRAYDDFRELLARDDIDAVVIGAPDLTSAHVVDRRFVRFLSRSCTLRLGASARDLFPKTLPHGSVFRGFRSRGESTS